jgi:AcrR family transcriptional regulator
MANVKNNCSALETKRKLIHAAGEVFGEVGLDAATIQQITRRAGTSLAAVNYHFTDKATLYSEVVLEAYNIVIDTFRILKVDTQAGTPQQRMHRFVHSFFTTLMDPDRPHWHCDILSRDLQQPNDAARQQLDEMVNVVNGTLGKIIEDLAGRTFDANDLILFESSIMGQILYYVDHQEFHMKLHPQLPPLDQRIDVLSDHIARFCIAAIEGMFNTQSN